MSAVFTPHHLLRRLAALLVALILSTAMAVAQPAATAEPPDYEAWASTAERAEATLELGRASSTALESLRAQIVTFRESFLAAQNTNAARIKTLRDQIAALGPKPAEGETEAADIVARRADLNDQLERLLAPVRRAEEAYSRANGLVTEIDRTIRERQADALFTIGPSPLNPANWTAALTSLSTSAATIGREVVRAWQSEAQRAELRRNLPLIVAYLLIAASLVLRGRFWMARLEAFLFQQSGRGATLWAMLVSLGSIFLPLIGLYFLTEAMFATGLFGLRGTFILTSVPIWGAIILAARWLGDRLFNHDAEVAILPGTSAQRAEARTYVTALAVLYVVREAIVEMGGFDRYSETTVAILQAPVTVLTGLILFRFGLLLLGAMRRVHDTSSETDGSNEAADRQLRGRLVRFIARATSVVGVVGPILAIIGYDTAADRIVSPSVLTLGLLGLLLVLHTLTRAIYRFVFRAPDADSLLPILANFLLTLAIIPPLSLIWGARVADLTEMWSRFRAGFQLGDTRISPTDFLTFIIVFVVGFMITRLAQGALRTSVLPRTKIDTGGQNAIISGLGYVGIFVAALMAITTAGIDLSSLAIVAGALSVGIGFGLQTVVSNFVSGIILLIERPIAEGDWIEVGGYMGIVKDISVRSTRIETFDRTDVIVPNADLISSNVINWTRGSQVGRVLVPVGVAYGTDTRKVEEILLDIARNHPMVLLTPAPAADFMAFGADALEFRIRAIIRDINWLVAVRNDMNHEIAKRFAEEGIEIPFAQRDIWIRNAQDLAGLSQPGKTPPNTEDEEAEAASPPGEGGSGSTGDA
ncbi:DUF3772 domain-containing protein [Pseudaestuariivita atlantica]|uniref:DUF3772 domain-containing protein n=1 Tax=Pseudaestuariivita atlantica TaxID=1317121 RepID=UPI0009E3CBB5|nr:DUF3772 domain-containing protein [Pseudaestuariivita atlantica]